MILVELRKNGKWYGNIRVDNPAEGIEMAERLIADGSWDDLYVIEDSSLEKPMTILHKWENGQQVA